MLCKHWLRWERPGADASKNRSGVSAAACPVEDRV